MGWKKTVFIQVSGGMEKNDLHSGEWWDGKNDLHSGEWWEWDGKNGLQSGEWWDGKNGLYSGELWMARRNSVKPVTVILVGIGSSLYKPFVAEIHNLLINI